jgi:hypothetical protein
MNQRPRPSLICDITQPLTPVFPDAGQHYDNIRAITRYRLAMQKKSSATRIVDWYRKN